MRIFIFSCILFLSLLLAHTAAEARQRGGFDGFSVGTPQTPEEELQRLMEDEQEDSKRKFIEQIRLGAFTPPAEIEDPFKDMTSVESEITSVMVFSDRAKVTRTATVNIVKGSQVLVFKDMSPSILPESLRAEGGSQDAIVEIGAIMQKRLEVPMKVAEQDRVSLEEIDKLHAEANKISSEKRPYLVQKNFLENLARRALEDTSEKSTPPELKPEQWVKASRAYRDGMEEVFGLLEKIETRQEQIKHNIARKENAMRRTYMDKNKMNVIIIPIVSDAAGELTLKVSYQIGNVTWQPHYDARLTTKSGALEIVQYGTVKQATREDWKNVTLTLSTAQPQRKSRLREIQPLWVDALEPQPAQLTYPPAMTQQAADPFADPLQEWRQKPEARRLSLENEAPPPRTNSPSARSPVSVRRGLSTLPPQASKRAALSSNTKFLAPPPSCPMAAKQNCCWGLSMPKANTASISTRSREPKRT